MVKDTLELARLMLETPIGGVVVMLLLFSLSLLFGFIPTPREYREMVRREKYLREKIEEKEEETRRAHQQLEQAGQVLVPTLQSIERRLDAFTPPERHAPASWLPWNRGD